MLRAIVVDDESAALETLCLLLGQHCGDLVHVEGCARSVAEARQLVQQVRPEVLFVDVEMPGESGFELVRSMPPQEMAVIFVTAHEHYAIQALRMSAVDYLLKPVNPAELRAAVERALRQRQWQRERLQVLLGNIEQPKLRRLVLPVPDGFEIVSAEEVLYCQSEGSYSRVVTVPKRIILTTRLLGQWEELLGPVGFLRIHRAFLVNAQHIRKVRRDVEGEGAAVVLSTGEELPISRRRLALVLEWLQR